MFLPKFSSTASILCLCPRAGLVVLCDSFLFLPCHFFLSLGGRVNHSTSLVPFRVFLVVVLPNSCVLIDCTRVFFTLSMFPLRCTYLTYRVVRAIPAHMRPS